ncbi:UDP-glucose 4-epimerase GalE [Crocinitomix catalasitica]|uniref:UDP-glucose 4-epimerase GalE n=1 Tax=Crocinitomix catalasitica TaxID=184607 RepID=UPI0004877CDD|nr:UDP-glucose 4-epimerase GalE [Crocinitomix catalasitica]
MNKKVIVTGGAGYIGSHTVIELIHAGFEPIIIDDFRNSKPWIIDRIQEVSDAKVLFYEVDCQDKDAVETVFKAHPDAAGVIHFAAYKAVGESVDKPIAYYQNNVGSLCVILELMETYKIQHFVFSSSCTVYGEPKSPIVDELTPIQKATSPYGDTKITCEKITEFEQASKGTLKAILLRYFNPIGAHESAKLGELPQGIPNNLVPYITQTAKGIRKELTVFGSDYNTIDGTNVRDYIHVVDLAKAHVAALNYAINKSGSFCEPFNLGTGKGTSVLEIIQTFETVNNLKLNYKIGPRRAGDVEQIYANANKANKVLNWTCQYGIAEALEHAWNWEKTLN